MIAATRQTMTSVGKKNRKEQEPVTQSMKAALVAFGIVVALTVVKFIFYLVSGSIAVLSEAWHSFADIATTVLVLLSIFRQEHKQRRDLAGVPAGSGAGLETAPEAAGRFFWLRRGYLWFRAINTEVKSACLIGLILVSVAVTIIWRTIVYQPVEINLPLVTGIIFVLLSLVSFFLYRFEENVGSAEQSAALRADSSHNRADMVISLLTGGSLICYYFGFDMDRWVGLLIAGYILTFASELLVNSLRSAFIGGQDVAVEYQFRAIVWRLFQPSTYRKLYRILEKRLGIGRTLERLLRALPRLVAWLWRWSLRAAAVGVIGWYASTALYSVNTGEHALVLRCGRISPAGMVGPGLHLKFPYPIDEVLRFPTGRVQSLAVGNTGAVEAAMTWTREHGDSRMFISGDNNLFLPYLVIHYRIGTVRDYYLSFRDGAAEKLLASSAYQLLNQFFSTTSFYDLVIFERQQWTEKLRGRLQRLLDQRRAGIEVIDLCLRDMHPPIDLARAFEDVVAAGQFREKYLNDAERQVSQVLAKERIRARETALDAQSYVLEKRRRAEGEAGNYLLRFAGYRAGGAVMKELLLLQSAQKTLEGKTIYLVDPDSGIDGKLLYMENYLFGRREP